ncbi:uncharacterized protein LOC131938963 [Physella acuta]|uniref:uncharacterized protein LOC131938963 n=1 Tax=Physella acuta TaxID=109671 RepID=UPI0027DAF79B|nr:uncharacterized protein LOC131938963 [Physella acuta]
MEWRPTEGCQPLAPFDHQVAGQSSMLRYDATTVCKPLIAREHFVYKTLPMELKAFTPEFRGEIEVKLSEKDGYIHLYGVAMEVTPTDTTCPCSSDPEPTENTNSHVNHKPSLCHSEEDNRCVVRVLRSGSYEVSSTANQELFYTQGSNPQHPVTQNLNPWSLKNHKRLLDKMRKSEHSHNKIMFLLLKNVVADFRHPCILDLKIGSRLHGDDASKTKVESQTRKCSQTTSSTLGLRLCGMQVYNAVTGVYHSVDKYHGRNLNDQSFSDTLYSFLHNGLHFRTELVQPIVSKLSQLILCLKGLHSFRFYASSLLIIYDGEEFVGRGPSSPGVTAESSCQPMQRDLCSDHVHDSSAPDLGVGSGVISVHGANPSQHSQSILVDHSAQTTMPDVPLVLTSGHLSDASPLHSTETAPQCNDHLNLVSKTDPYSDDYVNKTAPHTNDQLNKTDPHSNDQFNKTDPHGNDQFKNDPHGNDQLNKSDPNFNIYNCSDKIEQENTSIFSSYIIQQLVSKEQDKEGLNLQDKEGLLQQVLADSEKLANSCKTEINETIPNKPKTSCQIHEENSSVLTSDPAPLCSVHEPGDSKSPDPSTECSQALVSGGTNSLQPVSGGTNSLQPGGTNALQLVSGGTNSLQLVSGGTNSLQPVSGGTSSLQPVSGGTNSLQPVSGGTNSLQPVSGGTNSLQPVSGGTNSLQPVSGGTNSLQLVSGGTNSLQPVSGGTNSLQLVSGGTNSLQPNGTNSLLPNSLPPVSGGTNSLQAATPAIHSHYPGLTERVVPHLDGKPVSSEMEGSERPLGMKASANLTQAAAGQDLKVDVKMIDFAHTTHQGFMSDKVRHSGPDTDYIQGLENLVKLFQQLLQRG